MTGSYNFVGDSIEWIMMKLQRSKFTRTFYKMNILHYLKAITRIIYHRLASECHQSFRICARKPFSQKPLYPCYTWQGRGHFSIFFLKFIPLCSISNQGRKNRWNFSLHYEIIICLLFSKNIITVYVLMAFYHAVREFMEIWVRDCIIMEIMQIWKRITASSNPKNVLIEYFEIKFIFSF